tara:strand:- start:239 stop:367 length:129 start_codon:yes stop_codon:yes gene_type:complete
MLSEILVKIVSIALLISVGIVLVLVLELYLKVEKQVKNILIN